jgi:hypothetical protein
MGISELSSSSLVLDGVDLVKRRPEGVQMNGGIVCVLSSDSLTREGQQQQHRAPTRNWSIQ